MKSIAIGSVLDPAHGILPGQDHAAADRVSDLDRLSRRFCRAMLRPDPSYLLIVHGVTGRIVTGMAKDAHNGFDPLATVCPVAFDGAQAARATVSTPLPPMSVGVLGRQ